MKDLHNDDEVVSLKKILINGIKHWRLFLFAGIISLIPAILYLVMYPKTYEFKALIKLQDDKDLSSGSGMGLGDAAGLMRSFGLGGKSGSTLNIDDEIALLTSNRLLKQVVLELGLDVTYKKPFSFEKLYDNSPVIVIPDSTMRSSLERGITFSLHMNDKGNVKVKEKKSGKEFNFESLPASINLPEGRVAILSREGKKVEKANSLEISIVPAGWIAEILSETIEIDEYSKNANSIEFLFEDHNKTRGKLLLNTLIDLFNKEARGVKKEEGSKSMAFLDSRINDVLYQLEVKERDIEAYKLKNKMTDVEYDVQMYGEAIKIYREKIIELEAQSHIVNLLEEYVTDPANKYKLIPAALSSGDGEKGSPATNYNEALLAREKMQKTSNADNPLVEIADIQLEKLRESVLVAVENSKKGIDLVKQDLVTQEREILNKMGNVPTYEREYLDLKRQQEILQGVYLVLLQKREEIALSLGSDRDRGFLTDPAYVKKAPIGPRKLYAALFMIAFTLIIPIGYLFFKARIIELIEEYKKSI